MLLNSNHTNYIFQFPPNWFDPIIKQRYTPLIKQFPIPYTSITDYINSTVQTVSWPGLTQEEVQQFVALQLRRFKQGLGSQYIIPKELNISFRLTEGYTNYLMFLDTFHLYQQHYEDKKRTYLPDLTVRLLNNYGYQLLSLKYKQIVFKGLSELELSYSANNPEFTAFTVNLVANTIDLNLEYD